MGNAQQWKHACQALCKQGGVALGLAHKEVQVLVHDLLLAGVSHHLLFVLHYPLSLAPELHGLHPHKPSAISMVDVKGSGSNIAGCCSYGGYCCLQLLITTMIGHYVSNVIRTVAFAVAAVAVVLCVCHTHIIPLQLGLPSNEVLSKQQGPHIT